MNTRHVLATTLVAALAGCAAAPVQDEGPAQISSSSLTREQCAAQRDTCINRNPFFGWFTCPPQYTQCLATASDGVPAQVRSAIEDAAACAQEGVSCRRAATTPATDLSCTTDEANCVAAIVGAQLPRVVTGTVDCVTAAEACVRRAETASDLGRCAQTLQDCAVDQVVSTLPPEVVDTIQTIAECRNAAATCIGKAAAASDVAACQQAQVNCVANGLGVTLPQVPVAGAIKCAETATSCTLDSTTAAGVRACGASLVACNAKLTNPDAGLTCEEKWTQCIVANPFNFLTCNRNLTTCRD